MQKNSWKYVLVGLIALLFLADVGHAQLFRWRRGGGGYTTNTNVVAAVPRAIARGPFIGFLRKRSTRNRTEYDYNWAARRDWYQADAPQMLFADKVRVKVLLKDAYAQTPDSLRVRVHWVYLHKSKTWHTDWVDLQQDGRNVYYELPGLEEGRLVKVISDFYLKTDVQPSEAAIKSASYVKTDEGTFKYVGRMHVPYYGVTSSEDNEELKRRAQIVSFSFSQWYADESYGGRRCNYDCYSFFQSSTSGELSGFKLQPVSHAKIPTLAKQGKRFHGDYLIKPGHYGMALCYDEDTGNLCTIEGNYALNGPYRINIDPYRHGIYTWSSIMTISQEKKPVPAKAKPKEAPAEA
jgi:hypothetical protein